MDLATLYISVNRECFFLPSTRRVKFDVHYDDETWTRLPSTRSRHGLPRHLLMLPVENPDSSRISPLRSSLLTVDFRLRVVSRNSQSFPNHFVASSTRTIDSFFCLIKHLSRWFLMRISDASNFPKIFQTCCQNISLPSRWNQMILSHCSNKKLLSLYVFFSESSFIRCLPIC